MHTYIQTIFSRAYFCCFFFRKRKDTLYLVFFVDNRYDTPPKGSLVRVKTRYVSHPVSEQVRVDREGKRWEDMEKQEGDAAEKWDRLRDEGEKSKKNKSGVPYNMISLRWVRPTVEYMQVTCKCGVFRRRAQSLL